jgi:hypothetical protein
MTKTLTETQQKEIYENIIRAKVLLEEVEEFHNVQRVKKAIKNINEVKSILEEIKKIVA